MTIEQQISEERYEYIEQTLEEKFKEFKEKLVALGNETLGDLYSYVLPHVVSDTEFNIANRVEYVVKNIIAGKFENISTEELKPYISVSDGYGMKCYIHFSQYGDLIKPIYEMFKEEIANVRIAQLESEVKNLKDELHRAWQRY